MISHLASIAVTCGCDVTTRFITLFESSTNDTRLCERKTTIFRGILDFAHDFGLMTKSQLLCINPHIFHSTSLFIAHCSGSENEPIIILICSNVDCHADRWSYRFNYFRLFIFKYFGSL